MEKTQLSGEILKMAKMRQYSINTRIQSRLHITIYSDEQGMLRSKSSPKTSWKDLLEIGRAVRVQELCSYLSEKNTEP